MKAIIIIISLGLLGGINVHGQISLTSINHSPEVEYRYLYDSVAINYLSAFHTGEDTVWNFSNIEFFPDTLSKYYTRDTSYISFPGYDYNYDFYPPPDPNDTCILRSDNAIYRLTENMFYQAYEVFFPPGISGLDPFIKETVIPILEYPFNYGSNMDAGSYINESEQGLITRLDTWKTADAYGSIILNDTIYHDVLRLYTYYEYDEMTSNHSGIIITKHTYEWYHMDFQLPLLSLETKETQIYDYGAWYEYDTTAWLFNTKTYISPTSIGENTIPVRRIHVYPCPANNIIYISSEYNIKNVVLYNLLGVRANAINNNNQTVNVSKLQKGIYFIQGQFDDGSLFSQKIIISR